MKILGITTASVSLFFLVGFFEVGFNISLGDSLAMMVVVAVLEEIGKIVPILFLSKETRKLDIVKYAVLSAWVFALTETAFIQTNAFLNGDPFSWMRPLLTMNLHIVATVLAVVVWTRYKNLLALVVGIILASITHLGFNLIVINF